MTTLQTITCPAGMTGLACEPWSKGEIYAVAANWAQASCPVRVWGYDGWELDPHGRQVADFCHRMTDALESQIREAIIAGGDEPDDEAVAAIVAETVDIDDSDSSG